MSGAMRRIGEYLGLLEDTGRYDDYDGDYETAQNEAVGQRGAVPARDRRPAPVSDLAERRRPASVPSTGVVAELSRITTLHPRNYNEARLVGAELTIDNRPGGGLCVAVRVGPAR